MDDLKATRRDFAALSMAAGLGAAGAAAATEPRAVIESDVTIQTPDGSADAALFHPPSGRWPGVVIFADALGLRPAFRDMGRRLASEGYAVLVPNPFYRTRKAPVITGPFDFAKPEDRAKLAELRAPLTPEAVARDGKTWVAYLDANAHVNKRAKIGVQGYCMGGAMTMITAAAAPDRVGAGASFHGGGLVTDKPESPHLLVSKMKAAYLVLIADNDDQREPGAKTTLREAFDAANRSAKIEVYKGAQHGWCVKDGRVYDAAAAEKAWAELLSLYARNLRA